MTKEEVKNTAEDLLIKVLDYINASDIPGEEKTEIALEMACTLLTVTVDTNDDIVAIVSDIETKFENLKNMAICGMIEYKQGYRDNVKHDFKEV